MTKTTTFHKKLNINTLTTILIISDDVNLSYELATALEGLGCHTLTEQSSSEAEKIVKSIPLSLIIYICKNFTDNALAFFMNINGTQKNTEKIIIFLSDEAPPHTPTEEIKLKQINTSNLYNQDFLKTITNMIRHTSYSNSLQETEVSLIDNIYDQLLFTPAPTGIPTLDIAVVTLDSKEFDGEFYDFYTPSQHHLDLVIGDVMGKGIPSLLLATIFKNELVKYGLPQENAKVYLNGVWTEDLFKPHEIINNIHSKFASSLVELEYFTGIFYGRFDLIQRTFNYIDCGSTKPLHFSSGETHYLEGTWGPIGSEGPTDYETLQIYYQPGDLFVFFSNGISKIKNNDGEPYSMKRLIDILEESQHLEVDEIKKIFHQDLLNFLKGKSPSDDISLIFIKINNDPLPEITIPTSAKFLSDLSQLNAVRDFIHRTCQYAPGDTTALSQQMQLAINEIFTNLTAHSKFSDEILEIIIQAELSKEGIKFDIADQGNPYKPETILEPSLYGDREHGFGWFMLKKITDQIRYIPKKNHNGWNHLSIYKNYISKINDQKTCHFIKSNILVIKPGHNALDANISPLFEVEFEDIFKNNNPSAITNIIIDLSNVKFIDSSGISILIKALKKVKMKNGRLVLSNLTKNIESTLSISSLQSTIPYFGTLAEAIDSFKDEDYQHEK